MAKKEEESDSQLILRYQSGDQSAFTQLVRRWHKKFCHRAYWVVKDRDKAKDIAQESWRVIYNKLDTLKDPKNFAGWALRIVFRKAIDSNRKKSKEIANYNEYKNSRYESNADETRPDDQKTRLLIEIKKLPVKQQLVLKLFYMEEYSLKEISKIHGVSLGTVKSRLFHARETLKNKLK